MHHSMIMTLIKTEGLQAYHIACSILILRRLTAVDPDVTCIIPATLQGTMCTMRRVCNLHATYDCVSTANVRPNLQKKWTLHHDMRVRVSTYRYIHIFIYTYTHAHGLYRNQWACEQPTQAK